MMAYKYAMAHRGELQRPKQTLNMFSQVHWFTPSVSKHKTLLQFKFGQQEASYFDTEVVYVIMTMCINRCRGRKFIL